VFEVLTCALRVIYIMFSHTSMLQNHNIFVLKCRKSKQIICWLGEATFLNFLSSFVLQDMKRDGEAILISEVSSMYRADQVCRNGPFNKILACILVCSVMLVDKDYYVYSLFVQCSQSEICFNLEFFNLQPVCLKCWLVPWGGYT
jgi:hypothetical protein